MASLHVITYIRLNRLNNSSSVVYAYLLSEITNPMISIYEILEARDGNKLIIRCLQLVFMISFIIIRTFFYTDILIRTAYAPNVTLFYKLVQASMCNFFINKSCSWIELGLDYF